MGLAWYRWDVEPREPINEHRSEIEEVLEAALAFDFAHRVATSNRVHVMLSKCFLDKSCLAD